MSDSLGDYGAGVRWLAYRNGTAETVPAFALLRITGNDDDGTPVVAKPNADSMPFLLVNGPSEVIAGGNGVATYSEPVPVAYNDAATPAVGDTWGSANGSWLLTTGKIGWRVMSEPTGYETVEAVRDGNGGSGVAWSTTVAGILTTTAQTGGGRKTATTGTDASRGGWWADGVQVGGDNSGTGWFPFYAQYNATSPIPDGTCGITMRPIAAGDLSAPADGAQTMATLFATTAGASMFLSFTVVTGTVLAPSEMVITAGDEPSSPYLHGFAVVRSTVLVGIDRDFAAGDRPIVRGGIVVGYIDSGGTRYTGMGNVTATPTTKSLTLTTFLPTIITTEV